MIQMLNDLSVEHKMKLRKYNIYYYYSELKFLKKDLNRKQDIFSVYFSKKQ